MQQQIQHNQNPPSNDSCKSTTQSKMIQDLWGVMIALFGSKWTSQFGEKPDLSGQWKQTLNDISRAQVAAGLESIRKSGRAWPPTAPEFREICLMAGFGTIKSTDEAYAEANQYIARGSLDPWSLSPEVYHTISQNMDSYNFRLMDYASAAKCFHSAYRATLEQLRAGQALVKPPAKETLIEAKTPEPMTPEQEKEMERKGKETINSLMRMFGE